MVKLFVKTLGVAAICLGPVAAFAGGGGFLPDYMKVQNPMVESDSWNDYLAAEFLGTTVAADGEDLLEIDVPVEAYDATTVPFTIRQRAGTDERITALKVIIDNNPMPLVADFKFGPLMGDIALETRTRYESFSNVRAIAETEGGQTFMVGRFVKAAGGCTSVVPVNYADATANMGQMRLKTFEDDTAQYSTSEGKLRDVQLMIKHPNFTGMQVHEGTLDNLDARFVTSVEVEVDGEMLFTMEGGFSISENPAFRFSFIDKGASEMIVRAVDTDGVEFTETFQLISSS